jgi:hypothetical protein
MGIYVQGFLLKEFPDVTPEEMEILKAVVHYELFTSEDIRNILKARAQAVLDRLRQPPSSGSSGTSPP